MPIRLTNIRTQLAQGEGEAVERAMRRLGVHASQVLEAYVSKTSLDARRKNHISFVHTVVVRLQTDERRLVQKLQHPFVQWVEPKAIAWEAGIEKLKGPVVIAGFGPAGIFAAYLLAKHGYRPYVVERGESLDTRVEQVGRFMNGGNLHEQSNIQFGEGGAGTFSDGKLTTRISDPFCTQVIDILLQHGAPIEIKRRAKPHIGTDRLRGIIASIRREIIRMGGEIHWNTRLDNLEIENGKLRAVLLNGEWKRASVLLLSIGHSARDTFSVLFRAGLKMSAKAFSIGARIEHRQEMIERALYGVLAGDEHLPKGEYQLSYREGGRGVYTFCMCPGGVILPASSSFGTVVTNGMSYYSRSGENANSALVVDVQPVDFGTHPLAGVRFQQAIEERAFALAGNNYAAPGNTLAAFLEGRAALQYGSVRPSYALGLCPVPFERLFPPYVLQWMQKGIVQFAKKLPGFDAKDAILTAPETRTSSPVRIWRDRETLEAVGFSSIYPCGEGAGYAGGIMSAAVDGLRVAKQIIKKYAPY